MTERESSLIVPDNSKEAQRMPLKDKIDPSVTSLLVVDVQWDFCSPEGLLGRRGRDLSLMDPMIDRLKGFIQTAREKGVFIVYTRQVYDRSKLNLLQLEQYDLDGKLPTCDPATGGDAFYGIDPLPGETVYTKHNYNVFSNPKLEKDLQKKGVKTLIITGVDTEICVDTAIRNGFDLGYKIVVPEDLVATNARKKTEQQDTTLNRVKKTYGVVTSSQELLSIWNQQRNAFI